MAGPVRVMQIMGYMGGGGVEQTIMNHYRLFDRTQVQFDFVIQDNSPVVPEEEINALGGRIYRIPAIRNITKYSRELLHLILNTKPSIIHSNVNALSVVPLRIAKQAGVPIRIAHSHSTANNREILRTAAKDMLRPLSTLYPTELAACGIYSAQWLFGQKAVDQGHVHYIKNAIDLDRFSFKQTSRDKLRKEFGLSRKFVIGQVGRFSSQKNHAFSLDVFAHLHAEMPNSMFVALGSGPLLDNMRHKAHSLGLDSSVLLPGRRDDVAEWYSAFDALIFPSLYEGVPLTGIEAQAAGLPIIASNNISKETFIEQELIHIQSLEDSAKTWSDQIQAIASHLPARTNRNASLTEAGYDIRRSARDMQEWYLSLSDNIYP